MAEANPFDSVLEQLNPPPPIPADAPHYEAVGRFITGYANAEAAVHMLARRLLDVSDDKARVIFAGMRIADLTDRIRGMMQTDKADPSVATEIDACLTQLNLIAKRRHNLVHRTSAYLNETLIVTNVLISKSVNSSEAEPFTKDELDAMRMDCLVIYLRLERISNPRKEEAENTAINKFSNLPWRYISPPPKTQNLQRRKAPEAPKLPPDASHM